MRPCGPRFAKAEAFRSSPFGLDLRWCSIRGVAQSGLARLTGGQEVAGSNPVAPIFSPAGEKIEQENLEQEIR